MTRGQRLRRAAATLSVAAAGGALAAMIGLPVAWLLGSAVAVSIASLAGLRAEVPLVLRNAVFVLLGIQAGAGVTPEVLDQIALWPASFAIQMAGVVAVVAATYALLRGLFGWSAETALFAAVPGAMSFVLAAACETRADMTRVVVVQSLRLLLLIGVLVPTLAWIESGADISPAQRGQEGTLLQYGLLIGLSLCGALLGHLAGLPGGLLLGALVVSAVLHGSEIAPVAVPAVVALPALAVLGAVIGERLKGEDRRTLLRLLPASLGAFAIGLGLSAAAAGIATSLLGLSFGKVALAYAPGAIEALTVLAYQFNQDPAYVAAHHVMRFVLLAIAVPSLARRLARSGPA